MVCGLTVAHFPPSRHRKPLIRLGRVYASKSALGSVKRGLWVAPSLDGQASRRAGPVVAAGGLTPVADDVAAGLPPCSVRVPSQSMGAGPIRAGAWKAHRTPSPACCSGDAHRPGAPRCASASLFGHRQCGSRCPPSRGRAFRGCPWRCDLRYAPPRRSRAMRQTPRHPCASACPFTCNHWPPYYRRT